MGIDGTFYQCDEGSKDTFTCKATMGSGTKRAPITVWHTDYENYDIMYDCKNHLGGRMKYESFAVSSRTPKISTEALAKVQEVIKERIPHYDLDRNDGMLYWEQQGGWCEYE